MNMRSVLFIILIIKAVYSLQAQNVARKINTRFTSNTSTLLSNYSDSLKSFRMSQENIERLDEDKMTLNSEQINIARLFTMPTFYYNVVKDLFQLSNDTVNTNFYKQYVNNTLLNLYLSNPQLIHLTEKDLNKAELTFANKDKRVKITSSILEKPLIKAQEPGVEPIEVLVKKPNFWQLTGDYYLQFLQNYISENWYKGGESNYSMVASAILQAIYNNKQGVKWEHKLELKLGFQTSQADTIHPLKTSEDLIRYTGKFGLQASKRWYYTLQLIAGTQFMKGYKNNDKTIYSMFLAPLSTNLSLGMDYNMQLFSDRLKGTIHIAPLAYNMKYVRRTDLSERYGIKRNEHALHDLGSEFTADLSWKFSDMIKWRTRLYGYTTYKRAEFEWENTLTFQLNKFISTNIFLYPRFDDSRKRSLRYGYWEFKEYASIGFSYSF